MGRKEVSTEQMSARITAIILTIIFTASALIIHSEEAEALDETVIEGWVFDQDILPIANISISLESGGIVRNAKTNSEGYFKIRYVSPYYNYTVKAYSDWTTNTTENLTLNWGTTNSIDLYITELNLCGLEGYVRMLADGRGAYNAAVHYHKDGYPSQVTFAEVDGYFKFDSVPSGYCDVIFELGGYNTIEMKRQYLDRGEWNYISAQMWPIEFDLIVEPKDGSIGVEVTEVVFVYFTLPLDPESVDGSNFYIKDAVTGRILDCSLLLSENGTELAIVHNEYFDHETLYTITISGDIENIYNSKLGYDIDINFTTVVQPIAFQVESIEPGTDDTEVPVTTSIRVTFPYSINESTLNVVTVQLRMQGSLTPLDVTMAYYEHNKTLLIDPNEDLEPSTRYSMILSMDIQAYMKNTMFTGYAWNFETREQMLSKGTLTGYVDAQDGSLEDINLIWVTADNGNVRRETYLSMDGHYTFQNLDQGPWTITVSGGNYVQTSTTEYITAGEVKNADTIYLAEESEPEDEASMMTICVLTVLIIIVVISLLVILARKNTKDEEKRENEKPQLKLPPYAQTEKPVSHTVVEGHRKKREKMTPVGVGSELGPVPVEDPAFLLDEEDEDFEVTPGPVVDHSYDEDDEIVEDHIESLKERIKKLEEDIPFVEEPDEDEVDFDDDMEDEDEFEVDDEEDEFDIGEEDIDVEEFDEVHVDKMVLDGVPVDKKSGGPTQNNMGIDGEPGSPSKPRMLEAPPGFEDE